MTILVILKYVVVYYQTDLIFLAFKGFQITLKNFTEKESSFRNSSSFSIIFSFFQRC